MSVDLHVHTTASDGTLTPEQAVRTAIECGITHLGICDHDSVDGCAPAIAEASGTALEVVPGVELSAQSQQVGIHILGYFLDHTSDALHLRLLALRDTRMDRAQAMVDALADAGFSLTMEGVLEHAGNGSIGRSHIARALLAAGDVDTIEEAFARYIGRHGLYYIEKELMDGSEAIALIHAAGGAAVLAHPGISQADEVIASLVDSGLDGIEALHVQHSDDQRSHYRRLAESLGLIVSGGSDFHGSWARTASMGADGVTPDAVEQLRAAAARQTGG